MPRSTTVVSLFLASPSDVALEREFVAKCVQEWNQVNGLGRSLTFEVIRWENSVSAGFGLDGQDVVNAQVGDIYDVFVGLMWTRLGTKTERAESGTAEEYERVLRRYMAGQNVEIAFLFKDAPVDFRETNLEQLAKVKEFEERLHSEGAFTKRFRDEESLRLEINLLLDKSARRFIPETGKIANVDAASKCATRKCIAAKPICGADLGAGGEDDDEPGLYDIIEDLQRHTLAATENLSGMSGKLESTSVITGSVVSRLTEITALGPLQPTEAKPLIIEICDGMDDFSKHIEEVLPTFSENVALMVGDLRSFIDVSYDFVKGDDAAPQQLQEFKAMVEQMLWGMETSIVNYGEMRATILSLQRMTSLFNKSRRRMSSNVTRIIEAMESGKALTAQALRELDELIRFSKRAN